MGISVRNLQRKVKVETKRLKKVGEGVLRSLGLEGAECGLLFVDDGQIAYLNEAYLGRKGPTDVLSFPLAEIRGQGLGVRGRKGRVKNRPVLDVNPRPPTPDPRPLLLGDVVISTETARRQALKRGRPLEVEMAHLLIHGILHLIGYDHVTPEERRRMRRLERRFLSACFPQA